MIQKILILSNLINSEVLIHPQDQYALVAPYLHQELKDSTSNILCAAL